MYTKKKTLSRFHLRWYLSVLIHEDGSDNLRNWKSLHLKLFLKKKKIETVHSNPTSMYDKRHVEIQRYGFYNKLSLRRFTFYASIGAAPRRLRYRKTGNKKRATCFSTSLQVKKNFAFYHQCSNLLTTWFVAREVLYVWYRAQHRFSTRFAVFCPFFRTVSANGM